MSANDIQHGGDHYRTGYQHWDWCIDVELPYLESAATKYLSRWRMKNGLEDLNKALHYMTKAAEAHKEQRHHNTALTNPDMQMADAMEQAMIDTLRFIEANGIKGIEAATMMAIATWHDHLSVLYAVGLLKIIVAQVDGGDDPRAIGYWPGLRQASTAGPVAQGNALAPKATRPAQPDGSTNGVSDRRVPFDKTDEWDWQHGHKQSMEEDEA